MSFKKNMGFPGGSVVKNPPANAEDTGPIPGLGISHVPWSNYADEPQLLNLWSKTWDPQLLSPCATTTEAFTPLEPVFHNKRSHPNGKPAPCSWRVGRAAVKTRHSQKE